MFFCAGNVVQLGKVKNSGKKRVFCGGKSKNMVNSVVVNVEKERKKGCWKVSKTSQILANTMFWKPGKMKNSASTVLLKWKR